MYFSKLFAVMYLFICISFTKYCIVFLSNKISKTKTKTIYSDGTAYGHKNINTH